MMSSPRYFKQFWMNEQCRKDDKKESLKKSTGNSIETAVDSPQPVPTTKTNPKKRKATAVKEEFAVDTNARVNEVSIVTTAVHSTLYEHY